MCLDNVKSYIEDKFVGLDQSVNKLFWKKKRKILLGANKFSFDKIKMELVMPDKIVVKK